MLRATQHKRRDGVDQVVSIVETNKPAENEALFAGHPIIPRQVVDYRGTPLTETNLEASSDATRACGLSLGLSIIRGEAVAFTVFLPHSPREQAPSE